MLAKNRKPIEIDGRQTCDAADGQRGNESRARRCRSKEQPVKMAGSRRTGCRRESARKPGKTGATPVPSGPRDTSDATGRGCGGVSLPDDRNRYLHPSARDAGQVIGSTRRTGRTGRRGRGSIAPNRPERHGGGVRLMTCIMNTVCSGALRGLRRQTPRTSRTGCPGRRARGTDVGGRILAAIVNFRRGYRRRTPAGFRYAVSTVFPSKHPLTYVPRETGTRPTARRCRWFAVATPVVVDRSASRPITKNIQYNFENVHGSKLFRAENNQQLYPRRVVVFYR